MNPFLVAYSTPFETIPFASIKNSHFLPAIKKGIELAKHEIQAITENTDAPTFENTIEALEHSGEIINKVSSAFFNLNAAKTSDEMQTIAQEMSPLLSAFSNDIFTNIDLFHRIKIIHDQGFEHLTPEQTTLLTKNYKSFVRNGANLNEEQKVKLRHIDTKLAQLSLTFGENVLKDSNSFELVISNEQDLSGLPPSSIEAAKITATNKGIENQWVFTLDYPSYIPFMTYSTQRNLREKMYKAFSRKGFQDNAYNNTSIVQEMVKLRAERAQLLGYVSHADYVLEERMAQSPSQVLDFLHAIQEKALPFAKKEFEELTQFAKKIDNIDELQKWDASYYTEKLRKERFNIDDELLRPFFQLERVLEGLFLTAQQLFGITFHPTNAIETYHPDVITFEVKDDKGKHLGIFYADFFPRPGKRQGAWMTSFRSQKIIHEKDQRPHVSIVCNFTQPTDQRPSLLSFQEVTTLFHEFGHALHGIFAQGTYASLSGTNVFWDFVELPSQLMENWCYEPECLQLFAKHYKNGDDIPTDYINKIKQSANFMAGLATIRQIGLAKIDMGWHTLSHQDAALSQLSIPEMEQKQLAKIDLYPKHNSSCVSTAFSHIFQGGYSSGYYIYKWAEILDADAFEAFKEQGVFDEKTAHKFRDTILKCGGSEHPEILYQRFRGRKPRADALLERAGLIQD